MRKHKTNQPSIDSVVFYNFPWNFHSLWLRRSTGEMMKWSMASSVNNIMGFLYHLTRISRNETMSNFVAEVLVNYSHHKFSLLRKVCSHQLHNSPNMISFGRFCLLRSIKWNENPVNITLSCHACVVILRSIKVALSLWFGETYNHP